jgi:hypothetical protein
MQGAGRHAKPSAVAADAEYRDCSCRSAAREAESLACEIIRPATSAHGCLTPRSTGAATAGHQGPACGTRCIFTARALASCRCRPVSSNVRRHKYTPSPAPPGYHTMYVIKTEITDFTAKSWTFDRHKTMYGGKQISEGDHIYIFASETEGGPGLIASGIVASSEATPRRVGVERQTSRVSITVKRTATTKGRLGRSELSSFSEWSNGRPETELNFKFYRRATNKIGGISADAAAFLKTFMQQ